jgi:hypothetical protein
LVRAPAEKGALQRTVPMGAGAKESRASNGGLAANGGPFHAIETSPSDDRSEYTREYHGVAGASDGATGDGL